jgi:hypothetical protein
MNRLIERHREAIAGVLSCFDRVVITGTLPEICHGEALARYLGAHQVRLFDYRRWAEPFRDELRAHAERLAEEAGLEVEFIRRYKDFRKEARVKEVLAERGEHPGLVHVFSAMESCPSFRPWHDKASHRTVLKPTQGKCLHYYFYFIDERFGLGYVRVPTWAPFRLQVYFNGHHWLARELDRAGIGYQMADNAFLHIDDPERAQALAARFNTPQLHRRLDRWAREFCPVVRHFRGGYHWSLMQVELSTDLIFHRQAELQPLYEHLVRSAVHAAKAEHVATFLGRKLTGAYNGELGNDFSTRIQGTRIRHHMGPASLKLYDKAGLILRAECTANDVTFFRHHRWVEHRDGSHSYQVAKMKKSIYSLNALRKLMSAAIERYLAFLASLDEPDAGPKAMHKMAKPMREGERSYRGFNVFLAEDQRLFLELARGQWCISGFRTADLRERMPGFTKSRLSHLLKRLRTHGIIKKLAHRYRYYLTAYGRRVVATALVTTEFIARPTLHGVNA